MELDILKQLNETRARVWHEAKALLDDVAGQKRELSAEENVQWNRYNERIDEIDTQIRTISARSERETTNATVQEAMGRQFGATGAATVQRTADQRIRDWAAGRERRNEGDDPSANAISIDMAGAMREQQLIRQGATLTRSVPLHGTPARSHQACQRRWPESCTRPSPRASR